MQENMQEKSLIKKNILKYLDYKGISKYQFYKLTGITRGVLDQNNGMSEENTAKFLAVYGGEVSLEWLVRGMGEMLIGSQDKIAYSYPIQQFKHELVQEENECYTAMRETINIQKKYIEKLEEENEKLKSSIEKNKPGDPGQKRKAG
jgi:hypothetical protein